MLRSLVGNLTAEFKNLDRAGAIALDDAIETEEPLSLEALCGAQDWVSRVINLPERQLVVSASHDGILRVYNQRGGEPIADFNGHSDRVWDVVQITEDIVASVGDDNRIITWLVETGEQLDEWVHTEELRCIAKLDDTSVVVASAGKDVVVLTHVSGRNLQVDQLLENAHNSWVGEIEVCGDLMITCSDDRTAKIWDRNSLNFLSTLQHNSPVNSAAVRNGKIVTVCNDGKLYVHGDGNEYPLQAVLMIGERRKSLNTVSFINNDTVAVAGNTGCLYLISLATKKLISQIVFGSNVNPVESIVIMSDGRIALGGWDGFGVVISTPTEIRTAPSTAVGTSSTGNRQPQIAPKRPASPNRVQRREVQQPRASKVSYSQRKEENKSELSKWKQLGLDNSKLSDLKSREIAAALAAFLVNYEEEFADRFSLLKQSLIDEFQEKQIFGSSFIEVDDDDKPLLVDSVVAALSDVMDDDSLGFAKIRVKRFVRLVQ